jgi:serine incorporator 1/3
LGETDTLGIALGLTVTVLSMCWTGWSWTAEDMLAKKDDETPAGQGTSSSQANVASENQPRDVKGVVVDGGNYGSADNLEAGGTAPSPTTAVGDGGDNDDDSATRAAKNDPNRLSNSWKLNIILAFISCWMAMALTSWGEISAGGNAANPQVGRVSMWIVVSSEWIALSFYLWMLLAPRLFPDRDFS